MACASVATGRVVKVATVASMHPLDDDLYRRELGLRLDRVMFRWAVQHPAWARALIALGARTPRAMLIKDVLKSCVEGEREVLRLKADLIVAFIKESTRCGTRGVVDDYARLAADWGFDLSSVGSPVTVWHGSADSLVPVAHGRHLAGLLPNADFRELEDRGHFLPFTNASDILAELLPG